jgi:hypothetical protein
MISAMMKLSTKAKTALTLTPSSCLQNWPAPPMTGRIAKMPTSSAPSAPPTPCTPNASSESSYLKTFLMRQPK